MPAALADLEQSVQLSAGSALNLALLARVRARNGQRAEAVALLRQLEQRADTVYVPPYELAKVYDALLDSERALKSLERAYQHRSHSIAFLAVDPQLKRLRGEPRFRALVRRVGLHTTPGGQRLF
jgi:lipopolysaccharide biosynthesis regulator YciM